MHQVRNAYKHLRLQNHLGLYLRHVWLTQVHRLFLQRSGSLHNLQTSFYPRPIVKLGANFSVLGVGDVEINVVHDQKEHKLTFKDSLHGPDVTANLISISRMDQMGWDIVFGKGQVRFFKDKCEIFTGQLKNGLYLITGSLISNIPTALTARRYPAPSTSQHGIGASPILGHRGSLIASALSTVLMWSKRTFLDNVKTA